MGSYFVGGEMMIYLLWKVARGDFLYWPKLDGFHAFLISLINRVVGKTIVDFSGCLFFRHPNEMGGIALSVSMVWVSRRKMPTQL